jgi:hypothetical protein
MTTTTILPPFDPASGPLLPPPFPVDLRPGERDGVAYPDSRIAIGGEAGETIITGFSPKGTNGIRYSIAADRTVAVTDPDGWEAVIEDGKIAEFRPLAGS